MLWVREQALTTKMMYKRHCPEQQTAPWLTGFCRKNEDLLWAHGFDTSNYYPNDLENASDFLRTSLENKWSTSKILLS